MSGGSILFIDRVVPPLEAGTYQVSVRQTLRHDPGGAEGEAIDEAYALTRRFVVRGERFRLDPGEVGAVFPPANNQGEYGNVLPHVVLTRRTLPWERSPDGSDEGRSWLALLLFDDDDPPVVTSTIQVGDLGRGPFARDAGSPATSASTLPADAVSCEDGFRALGLDFATEQGERWSDGCQAIDVPVELFSRVAPSLEDLAWLAHAREVAAGRKAVRGGGTGSGDGDDQGPTTCSVLVGNRLPAPGAHCTVHLVSLEGMGALLPSGEDYTPAGFVLAGGGKARTIRLVSLHRWSYTSADPAESFEGHLTRLDTGPLQRGAVAVDDDGDGDAAATVAGALAMGYTALDHHTRQGDRTVSWYRGPLVPFQVPPTVFIPGPDPSTGLPPQAVAGADQLVRYDPGTGLMDVTYAAAWQMGRLLALQSQGFATGLRGWRRDNVARTLLSARHDVVRGRLGAAIDFPEDIKDGPAMLRAGARFLAAHLRPDAVRGVATAVPAASVTAPGDGPVETLPPAPRLTARSAHFEALHARATDPGAVAAVHAGTPVPEEIGRWLRRLGSLHGIPFSYLVPDEAAVPPESIRFFQVDPNWIHALVEGATSLGKSNRADAVHDAVFAPRLHAASRGAAPGGREGHPLTGFLLRSAVVSGWPGLEVTVLDAAGEVLDPVRMERLTPTLLLVLVEGVVHSVDVHEPPEGLHFGIDVTFDKGLRYVTVPAGAPPHTRPGDPITSAKPVPVRDRGGRALAVAALARALGEALAAARGNDDRDGNARPFGPAELALQMVEGGQSVIFVNRPTGG
ncbi:MAG TPA: hypothetical protein VGA70_03610 [Longimicrobiales bacterium]